MEIRLATRPVIGSGTVVATRFYSTTRPSSEARLIEPEWMIEFNTKLAPHPGINSANPVVATLICYGRRSRNRTVCEKISEVFVNAFAKMVILIPLTLGFVWLGGFGEPTRGRET